MAEIREQDRGGSLDASLTYQESHPMRPRAVAATPGETPMYLERY